MHPGKEQTYLGGLSHSVLSPTSCFKDSRSSAICSKVWTEMVGKFFLFAEDGLLDVSLPASSWFETSVTVVIASCDVSFLASAGFRFPVTEPRHFDDIFPISCGV